MSELRTVTLHGELGDLFGSEWKFAADRTRSVSQIIRALRANISGPFTNHMMLAHTRGIAYRVVVGGRDVSGESCQSLEPIGSRDVEIIPVPIGEGGKAGGIIIIILGVLLIATGFGSEGGGELIVLGVGLLVSGVVQVVLAPSEPKEHDQPQGTGFSGGSTVMQEGEPIPVLFGEGLVTGLSVSVEVQSTEQKSTNQTMRILDVISEGEIAGVIGIGATSFAGLNNTFLAAFRGLPSIFLDDVPATEFRSVRAKQIVGSSDQAPLQGFSESRTISDVNIEMEQGVPYSAALSGDGISVVRFNMIIGQLQRTSKKGDIVQSEMRWEMWVEDNIGNKIAELTHAIVDVILSRRNFSFEISIPTGSTGPFVAKAKKLTQDSDSRRHLDLVWGSAVAIGEVQFSYPNVAAVGIEFRSDDFQNIPVRKYAARGLLVKIPSNYDPIGRSYSGPWDGTFKQDRAYTNNPAWCLYELLTNKRFGMGQWIGEADVDIWTLYRAGVYCDTPILTNDAGLRIDWDQREEIISRNTLSGILTFLVFPHETASTWSSVTPYEPLAVLNTHLFRREEAWNLIRDLCSAMFAMPLWTGNAVSIMQDRDEEPVYEYNRDNVIGGNFEYSRTPLRSRTNRVIASYNDSQDLYQSRIVVQEIRSEITRNGIRSKRVEAIGATHRSQAARFARWMLLTEQLSAEGVSFRTGPETGGAPVAPGSIVLVHDPNRGAGKMFGRTYGPDILDLAKIRLDREVEIEAGGTYVLDIIMPSIHDDFSADRNASSVTLSGLLPNDDYRLARVWVDTTGDGKPDTRREPNSWNPVGRVLGLADNGEATVGANYRVEYPQGLHTSDISDGAGFYTELTMVTPTLKPIPETSVFIITKPSEVKKKWRIIAVKEVERGLYELSGIKHDPTKYDQITDGVSLEPPVIDVPTDGPGIRPPQPVGLEVSIQQRLSADGTSVQDIILIWREPDPTTPGANSITGWEVTWERFGSQAITQVVTNNQFVIQNAALGEYRFLVSSRRFDGRTSASVERLYSFTEGQLPTFTARTTGLEIEGQGNNTEFTGQDIRLAWRLNAQLFGVGGFTADNELSDEGGFGDPLLAHWEIIVRDGETLAELRRDIVPKSSTEYVYTYERNVADGGPRRDVEFTVTPKDSLPVARSGFGSSIRCTNPLGPAVDSSFISLGSEHNFQLIRISASYLREVDHKGFIFWISTTLGFDHLDTAQATAIAVSNDEAIFQVDPNTTYYWRLAAYDTFVQDPLLASGWSDLNESIEIQQTSQLGPALLPIGTDDIDISAVTNIQQNLATVRQTNFFDGTSGTHGTWELIAEQSIVSRAGVIEVAMMFNTEVVWAEGVEVIDWSVSEFDYYYTSVASTPRVKYRVTRRDGATMLGDPSTITLVEGGPMNLSTMGYFVGGFLSTKDTPAIGNFIYATEIMWLDDVYDEGQMFYTGLTNTSGGLHHGWFELDDVAARWVNFLFQGEFIISNISWLSQWRGKIRWRLTPTTWSSWWVCVGEDKDGVVGGWIPPGTPDSARICVDSASSGQIPGTGVPVDYEIDLSIHQGNTRLIMDIVTSNMLVMEWAR